jgi:hypothetical protein
MFDVLTPIALYDLFASARRSGDRLRVTAEFDRSSTRRHASSRSSLIGGRSA